MYKNVYRSGKDIPTTWYNILADYPELYAPSLDKDTFMEIKQEKLLELFSESLVEQELNLRDRYINIPDELMEKYQIWRPTPLIRAVNLEKALGTKCKIFYKYEGVSPIGSHKANSGVAQAFFNKKHGIRNVVAETGAGQWGSAISMASSFYDLSCKVFMVKNSFNEKPARRIMMQTFGSEVVSSPSSETDVGRKILRENPDFPGSLGVAISEAVEYASADKKTAYSLGSAFNFVCLHQTIIGQELKNQLTSCGIYPDYIVSCIGGGSSFAGIAFPFLSDKLNEGKPVEFIAAESEAVPSATKGVFRYDYGDSVRMTPLTKMYTLGHEFTPPVIHSGGLRYHGLSSLVSNFIEKKYAKAVSYSQLDVFEAAKLFSHCEGYIVAPEAAHSVKAAIEVAKKNRNQEKTIIFCLTGHGYFDLNGYEKYNNKTMKDSTMPENEIRMSLENLDKHFSDKPEILEQVSNETNMQVNSSQAMSNDFDRWWATHFGNEPAKPLGIHGKPEKSTGKLYKLLTETIVLEAISTNSNVIRVTSNCVITPLAQECIKKHNISIEYR